MSKPTEKTDWAIDPSALVTPTDVSRWDFGWSTPSNDPTGVGEKPNLNQQNYWQNAVHKWISYLANELIPVGTLEQTFLNEADYLAQSGRSDGKWVRCDGRDVTGSAYATITGQTTVPNVEGRFLRDSAGADAGLRSTQANQIGTHDHGLTDAVADIYTSATGANDLILGIGSAAGGSSKPVFLYSGMTRSSAGNTSNATNILGNTDETTTGSTETRPDAIIVNTFIKIN